MQAFLFLALILLVYFFIRFVLNTIIEAREKSQLNHQDSEPTQSLSMVRCAHCGVHLPQSEAYYDGLHTYCSEGHMKAGPASNQEKQASEENVKHQETES